METKLKHHLNGLETRLKAGSIDRRQFIRSVLATGIASSTALTMAERALAQTPQTGGHFKVGISQGGTSDTLNPAQTTNQFQIHVAHTLRNFLTEISPENEIAGDLAETWEPNADATEWRFKLRDGVEFHNGKTVDAEDVVASINLHRGENSVSAAKALLEPIEDVSADGKNAVVFKLASANADFPFVLTDYHLNILPKDGDGVDWRSGVGTGAYILENFEPGIRAVYRRNPNYFKEGRGNFDSAEIIVLNDPNARQTAVLTGDVHAVDGAELKTLQLLSRNQDIEIDNVTSWAHVSMPMHMDVEPFTSNDARLAFKYGIDRQELLDKILFGYGSLGNDHPISSVLPYYHEMEQREYDIDKAKFHLKKAGLENVSVKLSSADVVGSGAVDAAVLYREQLAKIGINLEVVREPNDGYYSDVWLKKPFCMVQWGGRPTADVMFSTAYAQGAPWNESHFQHDRFNELLIAARGELDQAKRGQMYAEMQMIVRDDGSTVIPYFNNHVYLRRKNVAHGPNLSANWQLDGNRATERWWFA
ncbi:putative D,D-dipeptide-binding periplasmic protein DdpA precursor [Roseovarius sp. THAF27]|uniref:ABC transporter substrate-binding protein n=1 Tax=Roseovarius sp. THAF27 TaxID=2587850 RepID=UPI0012687F28|nr:ABC transporter substrate-binding protein [Roseovarius sp. THAF27]QFT81985.1 putative D,D-dipeptide-binding periplasmic protein DdpA precursor [Roseovarius sp. THAF27]